MYTDMPINVSTKNAPIMQSLRVGALLVGLVLGASGSALALERSTTANGFTTQTKEGTCLNNVCEVIFDAVPAGKNLLATHASCKGIGTGENGVLSMSLNVKAGNANVGPTTHLTPVQTGSLSNNKVFIAQREGASCREEWTEAPGPFLHGRFSSTRH